MDPEAYNNMVLKPDFSHLKKIISDSEMLKEWGGEIDFDLNEYIAWRAEEEGISPEVISNMAPKRYVPTSADNNPYGEESDFGSLSSFDISQNDPAPSRLAKLWKRGSGVGFFSSFKWKEKLVSVGPGGVIIYFDSTDISEANKASRVIPLAGSYVEATAEGKDSKSFGFQVVAPSRSYFFSCDSRADLDLWLEVISEEITLANNMLIK